MGKMKLLINQKLVNQSAQVDQGSVVQHSFPSIHLINLNKENQ